MFDRCRTWRTMLSRRADGALSPSERALLDNHLTRCEACRTSEAADEALHSFCSSAASAPGILNGRVFNDGVVSELRALPVGNGARMGWRDRLRACLASLSFEFCMQLAGGGLAAAAVTAFLAA